MLAINMDDVINVLNSCKPYLIALGIALALAIIVTVVSVFLCMPVYAAISHLLTSALIDDSNRHLIGTETNDRSYIILKDGVYTNENGKVVDIEELAKSSSEFPESRIVKSSLMPNFIPSSIVEIPTDKSDEMYIIPEIILINNSLCVLTQDNGKGGQKGRGAGKPQNENTIGIRERQEGRDANPAVGHPHKKGRTCEVWPFSTIIFNL